MKSIGVVRKIDELGRIVLPMELRKNLKIEVGTPLEIFVDEDSIVLRKYVAGCLFCGEIEDIKEFKGKKVCNRCMEELSR